MQSETLRLLEWQRLCQHLATFAVTKLGSSACLDLPIPPSFEATLILLSQTQEALLLDLPLQGIKDIREALLRSAKGGVLSALELLAIAETLSAARNLRRCIEAVDYCPHLQQVMAEVRTYPELEQMIHFCIDETGTVLNRASPKLEQIRHDLAETRQRILHTLQHMMQTHSQALQENHITQREHCFVLAVKANFKERIGGIVRDSSNSGLTLFIEPQAVVPLHEKLRQLQKQETSEIERILRQLSDKVTEVVGDLQKLVTAVTQIDIANAKAQYGRWLRASPPEFCDEAVYLKELRHPLLVWQERHEQGQVVVPLSVAMSGQIRSVIITGPNTGGKTATLKTIGLVALMAKAGMLIPADSPAQIPYFDAVYADIGDEQSLQQSLSTFSGHIGRIQRILDQLTPNCLVLLDEVGAGTDPSEGVAIAKALLTYLAEHTRLTISTTHFGELKLLKYENPVFENASVEFDTATLSPTYHLLWGIPGRSQAIAIARRLGLNEQVLASAHHYLGHRSIAIEKIITELELTHRQLEERNQQSANLLKDLQKLYGEILSHWQTWQAHGQRWQEIKEREIKRHINQARREIGKMIRQLQKGNPASPADLRGAESALQALEAKHLPPPPVTVNEEPDYIPKIGDRIRIPKLDQVAQVLTLPNHQGEITVKLGTMRLTVSLKEIGKLG